MGGNASKASAGRSPDENRRRLAALLRERAAATRTYPLSIAQRRLWFLHELSLHDPTLNIPAVVRLVGGLDVGALEAALGGLVARHEVLRSSFVLAGGGPVQVVGPVVSVGLAVVDVSGLAVGDRWVEVERLAREEALRPFGLGVGSLLRASLVRVAPREHVLLLTVHHLVADGWSMGIVTDELGVLYEGFAGGRESSLAALPVQYGDFAVWQRRWLESGVLEPQLVYWRDRLAGVSPLGLVADRARVVVVRFWGSLQSCAAPVGVVGGVPGVQRWSWLTF